MSERPFVETSTDITGKHTLEFLQKVHRYRLDGEWIPGATDVKKGYPPSRQLIRYWIKQGLEEFDGGFKLKASADVGTITHNYCHALRTNGQFDPSKIIGHKDEEKIRRRLSEVDRWVKDRSNEELVMAEKICASPVHKFAGKFDVLVRVDGKLRLQDYKSAKGFFEDHFLQAGGYALMVDHWYGLKVEELEIIRFNDNVDYPDSFVIKGADVEDFKQQFLTCKATRDFQKKWGIFFEKKYEATNPWLKKK